MKNHNPRPFPATDRIAVVPGGSGMIGGAIVKRLASDPTVKEVRILDIVIPEYELTPKMKFFHCDVTDLGNLIRCTEDAHEIFDCVGRLGTSELELGSMVGEALNTNVVGVKNQLEAVLFNRIPHYTHHTKADWDDTWTANCYSVTKRMAELFCEYVRRTKGVPITFATFYNVSAAEQHLWDVCKMFPLFTVLGLLDMKQTVLGSGKQLIDVIHVDDTARVFVEMGRDEELAKSGHKLDIATGNAISVIDFATRLNELVSNPAGVHHLDMRPGEPEDTQIRASSEDIKYVKEKYGFEPEFNLDEIIMEYVRWWSQPHHATHIKNALVHFQNTDKKFYDVNGLVDVNTLTVDEIASKLAAKRQLLGL